MFFSETAQTKKSPNFGTKALGVARRLSTAGLTPFLPTSFDSPPAPPSPLIHKPPQPPLIYKPPCYLQARLPQTNT